MKQEVINSSANVQANVQADVPVNPLPEETGSAGAETKPVNAKVNLLDFDQASLEEFFADLGEPAFRARQVLQWIHQYKIIDYAEMSNLSKKLRLRLAEVAYIRLPKIAYQKESVDGTCKWLLQLECGNCIETVYIPEDGRGTLCVSSQIGCALNCSFCATARQGFNRNLSTAEIIGQVWVAQHSLAEKHSTKDRLITNVVMMGMGEPLLNFDNVVKAMELMMDDYAYGLAKRRVTLSTSGVVPAMYKLAEVSSVSLAVSLHSPDDELRNELVPINKKYPVKMLMDACRNYFSKESRRKVTFEYVMLKDVNDSLQHAKRLVKILEGIPAKVNLIPFNPFVSCGYERSSVETIDEFRKVLLKAGLSSITRKTRGEDIDAACGQLVGKVEDRTKRSQRMRVKSENKVVI